MIDPGSDSDFQEYFESESVVFLAAALVGNG